MAFAIIIDSKGQVEYISYAAEIMLKKSICCLQNANIRLIFDKNMEKHDYYSRYQHLKTLWQSGCQMSVGIKCVPIILFLSAN